MSGIKRTAPDGGERTGIASARAWLRSTCRYEMRIASPRLVAGLFVVVAGLVLAQQLALRTYPDRLEPDGPRIRAATGLKEPGLYTYGLLYWGLFPVYSTYEQQLDDPAKYDAAFARQLLVDHGESLRVEHEHEIRFGEHFKYLIPYFEARLAGRPPGSELWTLGSLSFAVAVLLLFSQLCLCRRPLLALFAALFIASSGFQAREVLRNENFSYVITSAVLVLALVCPLLLDRELRLRAILWRLTFAAAIVVAAGHIRTAAGAMALAPAFALLLYERRRFGPRIALVLCYAGLLYGWQTATSAFFDFKLAQANDFVEAVGGVPYRGERTALHPLWHPIYLGLADFDEKHGIEWRDPQAFNAAKRKLRELQREATGEGTTEVPAALSPGRSERLETSPIYARLLRTIVVEHVREDPRWYLEILAKRIQRTFRDWDPPALDLLLVRIEPWQSFWTHLAFLVLFLALGMFAEVKLVLATLPTIAVALAVTTVTNTHHYLIAHLVSAALISAALASVAWALAARLGGRAAPGTAD